MNSLPFLDVAIAVVFILTFLCLIATGIQEWFSHMLDQRFKILRASVVSLLQADPGDETAVDKVFKHPLVTALVQNTDASGVARPSYLPAITFAQTIVSILRETATLTAAGEATVKALIDAAPNVRFKKTLLALTRQGEGTVEQLEAKLASHFDVAMDRATGWYKRNTQTMLLVIGFFVAIAFNADLPKIAQTLYRDPSLRAQLVLAAEKQQPGFSLDNIEQETSTINLPLGWRQTVSKAPSFDPRLVWLFRVLGWGLTGAAISLGAPFWFDLLSHFVNLRSSKKIN
jgi:hypothetical protein